VNAVCWNKTNIALVQNVVRLIKKNAHRAFYAKDKLQSGMKVGWRSVVFKRPSSNSVGPI
jgi:hypothetical protein